MTAQLSTFDLRRMGDILAGHGDWFSAQLMRLIAKADRDDLDRLRLAFPEHVAAWEAWRRGGDVWDAFAKSAWTGK